MNLLAIYMKTSRNLSHRIGAALGKAWQGWLRAESRFAVKLSAKGCPAGLAKVIYLPILAVMLLLFFVAAKLLLAMLLLFLGAVVLANSSPSKEDPEPIYMPGDDDPRNELGYDPNLYNDYSHEQYVHDKE